MYRDIYPAPRVRVLATNECNGEEGEAKRRKGA